MTDEELDAIERRATRHVSTHKDALALLDSVRRLKARESLPVIATCGDCSHNAIPFGASGPMCLHGEDDNSRRGRYASREHAPPSWCPLRKETP
jgi:hypothetical protein